MDQAVVTITLILGFALRIGIPIAVTFLLGRGLRRLDARWRQEAIVSENHPQAALVNIWLTKPCWEANSCSSQARAECRAYQQRELPCWEVHRVNGSLRKQCQNCTYRQELPIPLGVPVAYPGD